MVGILKYIFTFLFVYLITISSCSSKLYNFLYNVDLPTSSYISAPATDLSILNEVQEVYITNVQNFKTEINNLNGKNKYLGLNLTPQKILKINFLTDNFYKKATVIFNYNVHNTSSILEHVINTRAP